MIECAYNVLAARLDLYVPCTDLHCPRAMTTVFEYLDEAMDVLERRVGDSDVHYFSIQTVSNIGQGTLAKNYDPVDVGSMAFWVRAGTDARYRLRATDWLLRIEDAHLRALRYNRKRSGLWEASDLPFGRTTAKILSTCDDAFGHYEKRLESLWTEKRNWERPITKPIMPEPEKVVLKFRSPAGA